MKNYINRFARLIFGLFLFAMGSFLTIQANIGLAPWDAFSMGFSNLTGMSYGNIVVITGLLIVIIDFLLKEKIGFGTIFNAILIGKFVDFFQSFIILPKMNNFAIGILMLLLGQLVISIASYFYMGAELGGGPRDSLMVALGKRFQNTPIGVVRGLIEGTVLIIGWALGAKVGIGTVISVFGIGFLIQFVFKLFNFDVKRLKHESIADTLEGIKSNS